ncbi:DUF732 domain-containing protein [Mycobacterium sp. 852002-51152_SCH6134967]|uniref:DUF732 domain-containing protein n=1 Tax=Mycobacterium sp. 852002-51152_SCH6134967 TaxID=1834096 RepID=UPI0009EE1181|nr:DUF732 domain-containing protein [Mycobacterium sp. 852002-51152_SCH6134967]
MRYGSAIGKLSLAPVILGGGIATIAISLVGATPASATPEDEYQFLQAIGSLGSSYASWPHFLSGMEPVTVGHQVCAALDRGGDPLTPVLQAAGNSPYPDYPRGHLRWICDSSPVP